MWHSNGLLWRKKRKGKKTEPNNFFLEACRKRQFGLSLIFLFFWGVGVFHFSGSRVSNLLCVRLIAIIIERVSGCNWIWPKQVEAAESQQGAEKEKVLPLTACCVLCVEGGAPTSPRPTSKSGAPPGQDYWAGLRSAPAAQASSRAAKWSHSLLMEPLFLQQTKPAGTILQMSWNEPTSETI